MRRQGETGSAFGTCEQTENGDNGGEERDGQCRQKVEIIYYCGGRYRPKTCNDVTSRQRKSGIAQKLRR